MKAALVYAKRLGWRVLPVEPGGKRPVLGDWPNTASSDPAVISRWIEEYPGANIGVLTGSGFFALDIDPRNGGDASLAALVNKHGDLPETPTQHTPSGGSHYLFRAPAGLTNTAGKIGPGIDTRGVHGQIVVSPSRTPAGAYRWVEGRAPWEVELAEAPAWLLERLSRSPAARVATAPETRSTFPPASPDVLEMARQALEEHGPGPERVEGEGGGQHAVQAGSILMHDFALTLEEAWPLFLEWNETRTPPFPEDELRVRLQRGLKYGKAEFGSKRPMDSLAAGRMWIAEWRDTKTEPFELIRRCRTLTFDDPVQRGVFERELASETGTRAREIALPAVVNQEARAARDGRQEAFARGDPGLMDPENPMATTRAFLAARNDAEGMPELVRWQGEFWQADESHYAPRSLEAVIADLYTFAEKRHDVTSDAPVKPDRNMVETLLHALKASALLETDTAPAWINGDDFPAGDMIAFRNGLLHVPSRTFVPPTRRFFNHNTVAFDYEPDAAIPEHWFRFLAQLWPGDRESIQALQEIFGLALTVDTSFQKLFMLIGPKRSGKGTIVRVLMSLVGPENTTAPTLNGLGQHFGLESMIGKQLAVISDARLSGRADLGAIVENLLRISGEDAISVPRKHRSDWTAKLNARFLVVSNEVPGFIDQSGALASRFIVLQLRESFFGREDRALTQRLMEELPGILLWALRGLDRLRARGYFNQPKSAEETVKQLENLASPIKAFVSERCEVRAGVTESAGLLYMAWCNWAEVQGRDHPGTAPIFARNLAAAYPELRAGEAAHTYQGIRLRES